MKKLRLIDEKSFLPKKVGKATLLGFKTWPHDPAFIGENTVVSNRL